MSIEVTKWTLPLKPPVGLTVDLGDDLAITVDAVEILRVPNWVEQNMRNGERNLYGVDQTIEFNVNGVSVVLWVALTHVGPQYQMRMCGREIQPSWSSVHGNLAAKQPWWRLW
jgi:hypothetical protein